MSNEIYRDGSPLIPLNGWRQIVISGLPEAFPPLRILDRRRHNLPIAWRIDRIGSRPWRRQSGGVSSY
jgi:hypothetical protein